MHVHDKNYIKLDTKQLGSDKIRTNDAYHDCDINSIGT